MYGYWYSVKENFTFSKKEAMQVFWTSLAFAFIFTFRKWGGETFNLTQGIQNVLLALLFVLIAMFAHVSLQKLVAIRLGYKATYSFWFNGILISIFLVFMSFGYIIFILPGSVLIEHIPKLRLGKFRFGTNFKDIARVAVAGPLSHIILIMIAGIIYLSSGKNETVFAFIVINMFLAVYSMLPIPKIDSPAKMDAGSDGLGLFFFSRILYVWVIATIFIYIGLILWAQTFSFVLAFLLGILFTFIFNAVLKQSN